MNEIFSRRSIRKYKDRPIEAAVITRILDAGRMAPSGKNRQPWKYIVFQNRPKEEMIKIMEAGLKREQHEDTLLPASAYGWPDAENTLKVMKEAPVLIAIMNTNGFSPFQPVNTDQRFMELCDTLSIGASVENILLEAETCGLGTLWIGNTCFAYPELFEFIHEKGQLVGMIAAGYADEAPGSRPRKSLDEIAEFRG